MFSSCVWVPINLLLVELNCFLHVSIFLSQGFNIHGIVIKLLPEGLKLLLCAITHILQVILEVERVH